MKKNGLLTKLLLIMTVLALTGTCCFAKYMPKVETNTAAVQVEENTIGSLTDGELEGQSFFYYDVTDIFEENGLEFTVTTTSGDTFSGDFWSVSDALESMRFDLIYDQEYDSAWTLGNSYTVTAALYESFDSPDPIASADVTIEIIPNTLESIAVSPDEFEVTENTHGGMTKDYVLVGEDWVETDEYFCYDESEILEEMIITLNYPTPVTGTREDLLWDDYRVELETDQSFSTPWTAGNSYPVRVRSHGKEAVVTVKVTANALLSVTAVNDTVTVTEGEKDKCSFVTSYSGMDVHLDGVYPRYDVEEILKNESFTLVYSDERGTVTRTWSEMADAGMVLDWKEDAEQSFDSAWKTGETHKISLTVEGVESTIDVKIRASALKRMVPENASVEVAVNTHGFAVSGNWLYSLNLILEEQKFALYGEADASLGSHAFEELEKLYGAVGDDFAFYEIYAAGDEIPVTLYCGSASAVLTLKFVKSTEPKLVVKDDEKISFDAADKEKIAGAFLNEIEKEIWARGDKLTVGIKAKDVTAEVAENKEMLGKLPENGKLVAAFDVQLNKFFAPTAKSEDPAIVTELNGPVDLVFVLPENVISLKTDSNVFSVIREHGGQYEKVESSHDRKDGRITVTTDKCSVFMVYAEEITPPTGDSAKPLLWAGLLLCNAAAFIFISRRRKAEE